MLSNLWKSYKVEASRKVWIRRVLREGAQARIFRDLLRETKIFI